MLEHWCTEKMRVRAGGKGDGMPEIKMSEVRQGLECAMGMGG